MENKQNKPFDLEERTYEFARDVALYCRKLPKITSNFKYSDQVIRSSGSVAGNYIEANEAISKKDFRHRIKLCRKEAKESALWLRLIVSTNSNEFTEEGKKLRKETIELVKIFSSMLRGN